MVKTVTFNIHHGAGVDKYFDARSNWVDQPAWLAARLKMNYVFAANLDWDPLETLIDVDGRPCAPEATVLVGDFNALPTSAEVKTLTTHLTDAWPEKGFGLGLTSPVPLPTKRIDYQLHSAQLATTAVSVPVSFASDHLPVAATYSLS
ncbi:endonuclease/exonuclease/phosphatase family protein [Kribbella jiaozuonensis]|uniref:Endonuclease/exonuclease/phosphatase domain-containing protein n=1 Tax=Kribbella jiaozuonensis TaxID=2575441 RepID=A0A4U3M0T9_9ACTN|nr:endonuclease/exonuclease/phosphatase family protein [Kribbella jiaozuonensis]TKK81900.1 hypothetical protein FDA38_03495 [Kribbella jiaozuonensis]